MQHIIDGLLHSLKIYLLPLSLRQGSEEVFNLLMH